MKKHDYKKLVLLGITSGLLLSTQALADENKTSSDGIQESIAAKAKCKGNHGCPGLTSSRDQNQEIKYYDPEKDGDQNKKNRNNEKK